MLGDVFSNQGRPFFLCLKGADLFVQGANQDALFVIEDRPIDGAWPVVQGKLTFASHIDDGAEGGGWLGQA